MNYFWNSQEQINFKQLHLILLDKWVRKMKECRVTTWQLVDRVPTSVTVNFSNFSNFSGNEVFFPMLFNQLKNGFLWNSNFWKIIFYAFQILKRKFLCFSPTWKSYFMVFSLHFRVLNLYFFGFFLTASASSTEKRKWLLHMSLFKYSLVV